MGHTYFMREDVAPDGSFALLFGGELDMHASPRLEAGIERALALGAPAVGLDLTKATFIDSTAIGVLVKAYKQLGAAGVAFEIVCDEPNVLRVFEIAHLEELLPIRHSRNNAAAA
jgi:anti-sigma B factor antagonist